ncbi:Hypothetical predicted protein [Podarcis lilfordi]|uniref:Uncharacterized protein n=1 Tax=Podarcis lilfordi TaxID=74358 RepID=A0AA35L537_9SAUR|nr:Hypothetical predicted protein [Podarcis lilfordi]
MTEKDGISYKQGLRLICSQPLKNLGNQNGHFVFLAAFDTDAKPFDVLLDDPHSALDVGKGVLDRGSWLATIQLHGAGGSCSGSSAPLLLGLMLNKSSERVTSTRSHCLPGTHSSSKPLLGALWPAAIFSTFLG